MDFIIRLAEEFFKKHKRLARYRRIFALLAAVVVFATTYELILPAITMDRQRAYRSPGVEVGVAKDQRKGIEFAEDDLAAADTAGEDAFEAGFQEEGDFFEDGAGAAGDSYAEDFAADGNGSADDWMQAENPDAGDTWENADEIVPGADSAGDDYSGSDEAGSLTDADGTGVNASAGDDLAGVPSDSSDPENSGADISVPENAENDNTDESTDLTDGNGTDSEEAGLEGTGSASHEDGQDLETADGEDSEDASDVSSENISGDNTQDASTGASTADSKETDEATDKNSNKSDTASGSTTAGSGEAVIEGGTAETAVEFAQDGAAAGATDLAALDATGQAAAAITYPATIIYEGKDYTVTATFDEKAKLPAEVTLSAVEILPNKVYKDENGNPLYADYEEYYQKTLEALEKEKRLDDDQTVKSARFFDITFLDKEGKAVEPAAPVSIAVKYKDALSAVDTADTMAVHFEGNKADNNNSIDVNEDDSEDNIKIIDDKDNRDITSAEITVPEILDTKTEVKKKTIQEISFEADKFSVYGVIGTEVLEKTILASDGHNYHIMVTCSANSGIPKDADLDVFEITDGLSAYGNSYEEYVTYTENALNMEEGSAEYIRLFDIKIVDKDGQRIQPAEGSTVDVRIELADADSNELSVVHFEDESIVGSVVNNVETDGKTVEFTTDGFSVYAITGARTTVDFLTAGGQTLTATVEFDDNELIPKGAELHINEILQGDEDWFDRSVQLADVLYKNYGNVTISDVRHLSIRIMVDGKEYTPKYPVQLTIQYTDGLCTEDTIDYGIDLNGETVVPGAKDNRFVAVQYTDAGAKLIDTDNTSDGDGISETNCTIDGSSDLDFVYIFDYDTLEAGEYYFIPTGAVKGAAAGTLGAGGLRAAAGPLRSSGDVPDYEKVLINNFDGTYTIGLNVTGDADTTSDTKSNANVIIVYDVSTSMIAPNVSSFWGQTTTDYERNNYVPMATGGRGIDSTGSNVTSYSDGLYFELYRQNDNGNGYSVIGNDDYSGTVYRKSQVTTTRVWYDTSQTQYNNNYQNAYTGTFYTRSGNNYVGYTYRATQYNGDNLPPANDNTNYYTESHTRIYRHSQSNVTEDVYTEYTGSRYSYTIDRAMASEKVVYDFTHALFRYQNPENPSTPEKESENIQAAFITFSGNADTQVQWTSNETDITDLVDSSGTGRKLSYSNYTNWTAAMNAAETLVNGADSDPTYVVFITDGRPQTSNESDALPNYNSSKAVAQRIQEKCAAKGGALYGIFAFANDDDWLASEMYYAYNKADPDADDLGKTFDTEGYFKASDTSALTQAINQIFQRIVDTLGIGKVSITDGTTSNVQTTSGEIFDMLDVDESSYKYWLSWNVDSNPDGTYSFTMKDKGTGNNVAYTVHYSNGNVEISWMDGETSKSATYPGEISAGNVLQVQWTAATDFYNFAPPAAVFEDPSVNWNLNSVGTLLDGVTYQVTFDCYPSQDVLDLIADLKNADKPDEMYAGLDSKITDYLIKEENQNEYTLKTNTVASLTYTDTRPENPQAQTETYDNPDPVSTSAVEQMAVSKKWENALDHYGSEDILLNVTRDGQERYHVTLGEGNDWEGFAYVSIGIMTVHNGVVSIKTPGHDFSFEEPQDLSYHWELKVPVVHPMKINGVDTILEQVTGTDIPQAMLTMTSPAVYENDGATYYKMTYGGEEKYYIAEASTVKLSAVNQRRSSLDVTKTVTGNNAPEDAKFKFDMTVTNPNASLATAADLDSDYWVWFCVDSNEDSDPDTIEPVVDDELITGTDLHESPDSDGYYYFKSGTGITVYLQAGWNLRFINLSSGTTYTVTESTDSDDMPDECFEFINVVGDREYYEYVLDSDGNYTYDANDKPITTTKHETIDGAQGSTFSGSISETNSVYTVTYTNNYDAAAVTVTKEADTGDGTVFEIIATVTENGAGVTSLPTQTDTKVSAVEGNPNQLKISLRSGETATINLREGQQLSIEETNSTGYIVTYSYKQTAEGEVQTGSTITSVSDGNAMTVTNTSRKIEVNLKKVAKGSTAPLPGAKFKLYRKNSNGTYASDEQIEYTKEATTLELTDGTLVLSNLPFGDYKLTEVKAPDGFIYLTKDIYFTVNASGSGDIITTTQGQEAFTSVSIGASTEGTDNNTLVVPNTPGEKLPHTGGTGKSIYTLGGIFIMMTAALMYVFRMRRRERRLR